MLTDWDCEPAIMRTLDKTCVFAQTAEQLALSYNQTLRKILADASHCFQPFQSTSSWNELNVLHEVQGPFYLKFIVKHDIYTFLIFIKRRPVRTGLAVATLRALCQTLALRMPLTIRTIAKANSELPPAATCLSALAPVAPVAPAICRNKHKRKPNECKIER